MIIRLLRPVTFMCLVLLKVNLGWKKNGMNLKIILRTANNGFGGGSSLSDSPGSKPDYTKPIFTINLSDASDLTDLLTLNVIPDPKDIELEKAVEIFKKYLDKNQEDRNKIKDLTPFVICNYCKSTGGSGVNPANDTPNLIGPFKENIDY